MFLVWQLPQISFQLGSGPPETQKCKTEFSLWVQDITQVKQFKLTMLGKVASPYFGGKAAESTYILNFVIQELTKYQHLIPSGELLLEAGQCLRQYLDIMASAGPKLTAQEYQEKRYNNSSKTSYYKIQTQTNTLR